jgi:site-specific DNA recombinase
MDRPALKRLLADIEAGRIDLVIVYKVDRLSRSLLDFAKMMDVFERHHVAFVAVTQQINSATSMGRLMLNVLLSFAQFEREIIGERTRDKIAAARRKGRWSGGHLILGYDVNSQGLKLVVNEAEAAQVWAVFQLYLDHEGLVPVVQELKRRGWTTKRWTTRKGQVRGGLPFSKTTLHKLLTNVTYCGQVRYKTELHGGEQSAIINAEVWQCVQVVLQRNGRNGGAAVRNQFGALLKGLLRCVPCGCAMTPAHSTKKGKRYRYYTCTAAQKNGWHTCPSKSIPACEIEQFVVEQIRCIGHDAMLRHETFALACTQAQTRINELTAERRSLERDLENWHADIRALVAPGGANASAPDLSRLADLQECIRAAEQRATAIKNEIGQLSAEQLDEDEVARALSVFEPLWESLTSREQAHLLHLLVERVEYDGTHDKVAITFHSAGIKALADEFAGQQQEKHS